MSEVSREERLRQLRRIAARLHELAEEVGDSREELASAGDPGLEMAFALISQSIDEAASIAEGMAKNPAFV